MHATEAIVSIDQHWLNRLTLTIQLEKSRLFQSYVNIDQQLFHAHELIERQFLLQELPLVVLIETRSILRSVTINRHGERAERRVFMLLDLKLGQDEGKLGKFGLSLLLDRVAHALQNGGLVLDLIGTWCIFTTFLLDWLRMEIGVGVPMELPNVDAIVFSG